LSSENAVLTLTKRIYGEKFKEHYEEKSMGQDREPTLEDSTTSTMVSEGEKLSPSKYETISESSYGETYKARKTTY